MKTDIEIAQSCPLLPITAIGAKLGLTEEQLECYGRYKAKLLPSATVGKPQSGKLILVKDTRFILMSGIFSTPK